MNEEFRIIAQNYCGMTPKDKGCKTWGEMQQKMADEIEEVVKNISSKPMLADRLPSAEDVKRWYQLLVGKSEIEMQKDIEATLR